MSNLAELDSRQRVAAPHVVTPSPKPSRGRQPAQMPLGRRLIEAGLIRKDQLDSALSHQASEAQPTGNTAEDDERLMPRRAKRLGEVVAELGLVDEAKLLPLLGEQLGVEGVRLREGLIDPAAVRLIPREQAERFLALPLMRVRGELTVAMADPEDLAAIDTLARLSGCRIRPVFTLASGIERLLPLSLIHI